MVSFDKERAENIKGLISSFAHHEPPFTSLGTPFLVDTETTQALVKIGKPALPALIEALDSQDPKIVMYAAYCIGQIGYSYVLPELRRTKHRFIAKEPKVEYDFGVISAINQAEDKMSKY
jgi:hypothetical protein